jgi:hypothetical protein
MVYGLRSYSIGRHGWASARTLLLWGARLVAAATSKAIVLALGIFIASRTDAANDGTHAVIFWLVVLPS